MKKFWGLFFIFHFNPLTYSFDGNIAVWSGDQTSMIRVPLLALKNEKFENDLIEIKNQNLVLQADSTGCFCYEQHSPEFAAIQAFYYASLVLTKLNQTLVRLGYQKLPKLNLFLQKLGAGLAPRGSTANDGFSINLDYDVPAFDPTLLTHEIGHALHIHLLEKELNQVLEAPNYKNPGLTYESLEKFTCQIGVTEGVAHLTTVLLMPETSLGSHSYLDAAFEMNSFVRFPDQVPTAKSAYEKMLPPSLFAKKYPRSSEYAQKMLNNEFKMPYFEKSLDLPYPYLASASVIQPLLLLAKTSNHETILETHLHTLVQMKSWVGYTS